MTGIHRGTLEVLLIIVVSETESMMLVMCPHFSSRPSRARRTDVATSACFSEDRLYDNLSFVRSRFLCSFLKDQKRTSRAQRHTPVKSPRLNALLSGDEGSLGLKHRSTSLNALNSPARKLARTPGVLPPAGQGAQIVPRSDAPFRSASGRPTQLGRLLSRSGQHAPRFYATIEIRTCSPKALDRPSRNSSREGCYEMETRIAKQCNTTARGNHPGITSAKEENAESV